MEINPEATGKILGMAMAYGVSSLGLLLAYINYRKRILKAEKIFTPKAKVVLGVVVAIAASGFVFLSILTTKSTAVGGDQAVAEIEKVVEAGAAAGGLTAIGVVVPVLIFGFAFTVTWLLYRHFMRQMEKEQ